LAVRRGHLDLGAWRGLDAGLRLLLECRGMRRGQEWPVRPWARDRQDARGNARHRGEIRLVHPARGAGGGSVRRDALRRVHEDARRSRRAISHPREKENAMEFEYSKRTKEYMEQLTDFMNKHVYPNERTFTDQLNSQPNRWQVPQIM